MAQESESRRSHPPRFFCEHVAEGEMDLPPAEARHAAGPLRMAAGGEVVLFDGGGLQWPGRIIELARRGRRVRVEVGPPQESRREPALAVTVATALPKGRRWDWLLEQCTELGAAAIWALRCRRSVHVPEADKRDAWRRTCIEAAKQCGRNRLPDLAGPMTVAEALAGGPSGLPGMAVSGPEKVSDTHAEQGPLFRTGSVGVSDTFSGSDTFSDAVPGSPAGPRPFDLAVLGGAGPCEPFGALAALRPAPRSVLLLIGPEGGFTDAERAAALAAGARLVSLGPTILRTETAAAALLAAAHALWPLAAPARPSREIPRV